MNRYAWHLESASARPPSVDGYSRQESHGASMWDYFAAAALAACYDFQTAQGKNGIAWIAAQAAQLADQMMLVREAAATAAREEYERSMRQAQQYKHNEETKP
jgi:hypothetical protein